MIGNAFNENSGKVNYTTGIPTNSDCSCKCGSNTFQGTNNCKDTNKVDKAEFDKILDKFRNEILKMRDNTNYLTRSISKFTQPDVDVKLDYTEEVKPQTITENLFVLLNEMTIENAKLIEIGSLLTKLVG